MNRDNNGRFMNGRIPHNLVEIEDEVLIGLYWGEDKSISVISRIIHLSNEPTGRKLKHICNEHGFIMRSVGNQGKLGKEKHWNWQGGITYSGKQKRVGYREFCSEVLKRDNYTCQLCDAKHKNGFRPNLCAHHLKSYKDYPKLRRDIDNGITLCEKCHILIHQINLNILFINDGL